MTQNELAFWRDAVIAALHAPGDAIERANLALVEYRKAKSAADDYHKEFADKLRKAYEIALEPQSTQRGPTLAEENPGDKL